MKIKIMKSLLILISTLLLPLTIWAMTPLTDTELSEINGQAGVSIWVDITMDIHIDVIAWGDSDGLGGNNTGGDKSTGSYPGASGVSITDLSTGPHMYSSIYERSYPSAIKGAKIIAHTVDYLYSPIDLSILQNPIGPWNSKQY
jgi:hypothetical protein